MLKDLNQTYSAAAFCDNFTHACNKKKSKMKLTEKYRRWRWLGRAETC